MKKLFVLITILTLLMGCSPAQTQSPSVVTTSFVTYDFARTITGDDTVHLLLKPGQESHGYEPTSQDLVLIEQADVFIYTNDAMEPWVFDVLKSVNNPDLLVINASANVKMHESDHDHEDEDEADHDDEVVSVDPHTWTSMKNAVIMVETIADSLGERANPDNTAQLIGQLEDLDAQYQSVFASATKKNLVFIGHFALSYLLEDYGMEYTALFESFSHESEPTIGQLQNVIDLINSENLSYVFVEELSELRIVDSIVEETGVTPLELSASHNISQEQIDNHLTFVQIQEINLINLQKGLQ